jgi:hypothetical protein
LTRAALKNRDNGLRSAEDSTRTQVAAAVLAEMRLLRAFRGATVALLILSNSPCLFAQWMGRQTGCYAPSITANPNRPTVANPADITQYGVLELEYGWDRTALGAGAHQTELEGLLKFGLLCDIELRWTMTNYIWQSPKAGNQSGTGDNWFGPQVRFYHQTAHVPTLALNYAVKAPTASSSKGLGSGVVDHSVTFLASKDIKKIHFDFNATSFWIGKPAGSGFDQNYQLNLAFSRTIKGRLGFTGEFYGNTELNPATPGFVSSLWAPTFAVTPRLIIDAGIEIGLSHGAPQQHFFVGVTYAIANLYTAINRRRNNSNSSSLTN